VVDQGCHGGKRKEYKLLKVRLVEIVNAIASAGLQTRNRVDHLCRVRLTGLTAAMGESRQGTAHLCVSDCFQGMFELSGTCAARNRAHRLGERPSSAQLYKDRTARNRSDAPSILVYCVHNFSYSVVGGGLVMRLGAALCQIFDSIYRRSFSLRFP
jgi:hypothetical protein